MTDTQICHTIVLLKLFSEVAELEKFIEHKLNVSNEVGYLATSKHICEPIKLKGVLPA